MQPFFRSADEPLPVLDHVDVGELVQDEDEILPEMLGKALRKAQDGLHIAVVEGPSRRENPVLAGEYFPVEHEVRAAEEGRDEGLVLLRRGGDAADGDRADPGQEILPGPHVQQAQLPDGEGHAGHAEIEQGLLDEGGLAALRGTVEGHVLALTQEAPEDGAVLLPADEVLAGHILAIDKWRIHMVITF